jgi:hypothetical protein
MRKMLAGHDFSGTVNGTGLAQSVDTDMLVDGATGQPLIRRNVHPLTQPEFRNAGVEDVCMGFDPDQQQGVSRALPECFRDGAIRQAAGLDLVNNLADLTPLSNSAGQVPCQKVE